MSIESCSCERCSLGCRTMPGFFAFGEVERLASSTQQSVQQVFDRTLVAVEVNGRNPYCALAPATVGEMPGTKVVRRAVGACVFFHKGLCDIHPVKPDECKSVLHDITRSEHDRVIHRVLDTWRNDRAQNQVRELLANSAPWKRQQGVMIQ